MGRPLPHPYPHHELDEWGLSLPAIPDSNNNSQIRVCTYNIQTFHGKTDRLLHFVDCYNIDILALAETRWRKHDFEVEGIFQNFSGSDASVTAKQAVSDS